MSESGLPEIHVSELRTFRSCRLRWSWSSGNGRYLEPLHPPKYFLLGKAVHFALACYYDGVDPLRAYDLFIRRDLKDLPPEETDEYLDTIDLGRRMVENYVATFEAHDRDRWEIISTELVLRQELKTPSGIPFEISSRLDGLWRNKRSGKIWVNEFKTARSITDAETDWIYRDLQPAVYLQLARANFGPEVEGVMYQFLSKKAPEPPKVLKSGKLSVSKSQPTTYALFIEALQKQVSAMNIEPEDERRMLAIFKEDYQDYLLFLQAQGTEAFFKRIAWLKTPETLALMWSWLLDTIDDMLSDPHIYPTDNKMACQLCPFKDPCRVLYEGGDPEVYLHEDFRKRDYWEDDLAKEEILNAIQDSVA